MSRKVIPERVERYCDACMDEITRSAHGASLKLQCTALDYQGNACADGSLVLEDLCDKCAENLYRAIEEWCHASRREPPK